MKELNLAQKAAALRELGNLDICVEVRSVGTAGFTAYARLSRHDVHSNAIHAFCPNLRCEAPTWQEALEDLWNLVTTCPHSRPIDTSYRNHWYYTLEYRVDHDLWRHWHVSPRPSPAGQDPA